MNKQLFSHIALLTLVATGAVSCVGDLDVTPKDPSTEMTVNEVALYTKCYANMALAGNTGGNGDCDIDGLDGGTTGFVRQLFNAQELTTDEAICGWGDPGIPAFNFNEWDAAHPMLKGFYYRLYTGISYCNHYLEVCGGTDAQRTAEIRFLRCLYYYHLMDLFGNVPFTLEISATSPSQISREDLFNWLETEIKEVLPELATPVARTSKDDGYGTVDQDAANLLLSRMYLNAKVYTGTERWQDCMTYSQKVIDGPHKLFTDGTAKTINDIDGKSKWSSYQMLFMGDNGENGSSVEAILPLLQDGVTTTAWCTTLFLMASTWKSDMNTYGNYGTSEFWAGNRTRSQFVGKFFDLDNVTETDLALTTEEMVKKAGDARALLFGKDRKLKCTDTGEFTDGFSVAKFRNTYSTGAAPSNSQFVDADYFLMRSAEAYLNYAEAEAWAAGGKIENTTGVGYINQIRSRSFTYAKTTYTTDDILDERARELYYEGFRRTDLIRHGYYGGEKSGSYVWEWKGHAENGAAIPAYRNLFALPSEDINANPNLKQNTGY